MKSFRHCPNLAIFTLFAFLTFMTFGTTLTSCGGGDSTSDSSGEDSGGDDNGGGETTTTPSFDSFQTATTDSTGKATFTSTALSGVSSVEATFTLPNGQAASGITVYYSETDDGHFMIVSRDSSGTYQSNFITSDVDTVAANSSVEVPSLMLESGDVVPASIERNEKSLTILAMVLIAGASLAFTVGAISLVNRINNVAGKIDPVRLAKSGSDCFSVNTLFEHIDIAMSAVDLVFWTTSTIASGGSNLTVNGLYEILLENITDSIKDEVEQRFWDEVLGTAFAGIEIDANTDICWVLRSPNMDYSKILEIRADVQCTEDSDCDNLTVPELDFAAVDGDRDGYTAATLDCNDQNARVYPGAFEVCDSGIDYNCDGSMTTCNVTTTNLYMNSWPDNANLSDGGSGDVSLVLLQGSFIGTGSDILPEVRIIVNDNAEQVMATHDYGGGQFGFWDIYTVLKPGLNRIQVAGQGGTHYGSKTYTYTNTNTASSLTIMLSWDACPNLDLYIVEPNSGVIYSGNTTGTYGSMTYTTAGGWGPEIYKALNPAAGQTYFYYVKHAGNGSCGAAGYSADYTIRVFTPYGDETKTGTISDGGTSGIDDVMF